MTDFEKVEKLKEKANVSYEEAKAALDEANGDILDAIILLENQGKTKKPNNESYSTKYEESNNLPAVTMTKEEAKKDRRDKMNEFRRKFRAFIDKLFVNFLVIERNEKQLAKLPLWMFAIIVILGINVVPIVMVISLFFGVKYSFVGEDEMKVANDVANKAEVIAEEVTEKIKDEYNRL